MLTVAMPGAMELFNTQRKFYETLGFAIHPNCRISAKYLIFLISSIQLFISTTAFFLFEARTAVEYGMSFYISITIVVSMVNISTIGWKMEEVLALIRNYEEFIENS